MERQLLLLGMLRLGDAHGYQLMETLDSHIGLAAGLTKSTAYRLLEDMARQGWLDGREERPGKHPPRIVYTLTSAGDREFNRLLRECLARYEPAEYGHDVGLLFCETLPRTEAVLLLRQRLEHMEKRRLEMAHSVEQHSGSPILAHHLRHLELDCDYVARLIDTIERQKGATHE